MNVVKLSAWLKTYLKGHKIFYSLSLVQESMTFGVSMVIRRLWQKKRFSYHQLKKRKNEKNDMHMLAIYWEPKSAFQNTFCRYSTITISKHNNSTTEKPSGHLSLRHSWAPVTVPEALPALRPGKMPVFVWYLSGILPVFVRNPVPGLYRTSPGAPDRTENTFYLICNTHPHKIQLYNWWAA